GKNNSSYLAYSIIQEYYSKAILEDNKKYLNDASEFINRQLSRNNADVRLVLYSAFIDIEMGNSARAEKNIHLMYKYTKYFKINDEVVYCAILFLNIIFDIKYKKGKKADKLISMLDGEVQKKNLWVRELFMAYIYMEKGESDELTARRISNSFIYGAKSRFYYILLYKYYNEKGERLYKESKMLVGFLKWGLCHNAMLEGILDRCNTKIPFVFFMNSFTGARLYNKYPNKWILEQLCKILMCNLDHSVYAFDVYNSAVRQQIEVVGLIDFLIKSGYENDIDDIGIYPIKRFLEQGNVDFEMKVYIYYIILGNKKFSELRDEYEKDIIDVGIKGIKKNKDERYFYEIYKFLLDKTNKYEIDAQTEQTAEDILYKHLFEYEVKTEKKVSYIWIREKEKNKLEFFEVNDGKAYITASGNEFDKYFFDDEKKTLIESNAVIRRCIKNADMRLYVRYYLKGKRDNNILINLAKYYMNIENANEKNIFILKEALEEKNISRNFRMRLRAAIGNIYFGNGEYKEAAEYYKYIDINMISEKSVENMTRTFLEADEKKKLTE
ncbi:MAG: hypothetical protein IJ583_11475, partial [Firmicutes bacterium]|nr:hypothetical protein [Bacillota bacterium]